MAQNNLTLSVLSSPIPQSISLNSKSNQKEMVHYDGNLRYAAISGTDLCQHKWKQTRIT